MSTDTDFTLEQVAEVRRGLDIIMRAVGAPTIDELLLSQESLLAQIPEEARAKALEDMTTNVVKQFGASTAFISNSLKAQMDKKPAS
jgi:hypothetical protein